MRLLMLSRYGPLGASSRMRTYQYAPALERAGIEVAISPLFGDDYVHALYARKRAWGQIVGGYLRRLGEQLRDRRFDAVWIEKELLPWLPAWTEFMRGRHAVVVDYDDAIFHRYDQHSNPWVRRFLGRRIDSIMSNADMVTAGNAYLAARAESAGCRRVERLPTVVDLQRYSVRASGQDAGGPVRIGWIGSPATAHYLQIVAPAVARLRLEREVDLVAVGARADQVRGTPFRAMPWTEEGEAALVASFDIGIMPLPDEPWERGKCGYKLIQYMACGVPVVASPVGVNTEIVSSGQNGLLASEQDDWHTALLQLVDEAQTRIRMGQAGRKRVEQWYSLQVQVPRLVAMLHDVARERR